MKVQSMVAILMASAFLTACGGSSGSGSDETPNSSETPETPEVPETPENPESPDTSEPDAVVLNNDTAMTDENSAGVMIPVFANDEGITAELKNTLSTSAPAYGELTANDDGTLNYKPNADYYGEDTFTYSVYDNANEQGHDAAVTVTINPVTQLKTVMTYPSPNTIRNFGGAASIQARGQVTNPDGTQAQNSDIAHVSINNVQVPVNGNDWQGTAPLQQADTEQITAITKALDSSESSAQATIKNETVMTSLRRIAYAGNQITYIVDEYSDALIQSDGSVALGHQSILIAGTINGAEHELRDVAWDETNNRVILAADPTGISENAKVFSVNPETGDAQLLYQDSNHQRYAALEWINNNQFIALSGSESTSNSTLIHLDISDPQAPVKTEFAGAVASVYGDISFYDGRIYMAQYNERAIISIGLPEAGESWASYSVVSGTSGSESKGTGPNMGTPRGLVATDGHVYVADGDDLLQINTGTGDRTILTEDLRYALGIDLKHDAQTPQLMLADDFEMILYEFDLTTSQLSISALNQTGEGVRGEHGAINGMSLVGNQVYVSNGNRIMSISMINGQREILDISLPTDSVLTELVYDDENQWLFAGDSRRDAVYKVDLSDPENITYSTFISGNAIDNPKDIALTKVEGVSHLLITDNDKIYRVNTEIGAAEYLAVDVPNSNDIIEIEAGESTLYMIQQGYDGILKVTKDASGCFCNRQNLYTGAKGIRPSTLFVTEDESTTYFTSTGRRMYEMDLNTGVFTEVLAPADNAILHRSPLSLVHNPETDSLLTADSFWRGVLETDIKSGQRSIVSQ